MMINLEDGSNLLIIPYENKDFEGIQKLNKDEGWTNLVENSMKTKSAWENSNIAFVVETESGKLVGYIRGQTDTSVSLFVCEMLIHKNYRNLAIGRKLLQFVHDLYPDTRIEVLATSTSRSFYENLGYRPFYGYRKTYSEEN
ncbi:GNAT family N-acetyltransferase [Sporosarcina sp. A2]|uniref:GNAT family N-acetyltransferase n=1 Tax=Sporosarcina sp. A2 TaxID=3393449 RepID=UPI003D7B37C7